jgi:predicted TIM-barrel fold metal-dependent hydrolase
MPFPDLIHGYLRVGQADRLLYGSDYPYTPAPVVEGLSHVMDTQLKNMFEEAHILKIFSGNAESLGL